MPLSIPLIKRRMQNECIRDDGMHPGRSPWHLRSNSPRPAIPTAILPVVAPSAAGPGREILPIALSADFYRAALYEAGSDRSSWGKASSSAASILSVSSVSSPGKETSGSPMVTSVAGG